jgi:hypothetical protein
VVSAAGSEVLSKVKEPVDPGAMALPVLFPNWTESDDVVAVQPVGPAILVGTEGRLKLPWVQPYQKALIGLLPVLVKVNEY